MKKHLLKLAATLMLVFTSCAGNTSVDGQQNFITNEGSDKFIKGKVVLNLASKSEVDKAYEESIKNMKEKPSGDEAKAYWYDTARLVGKDLGTIVYDEDKTGNYSLFLDLNGEIKNYFPTSSESGVTPDCNNLIDDAYLQLYFVSTDSKYKIMDNSKFALKIKAKFVLNTINISNELELNKQSSSKAHTNIPLLSEPIKHIFGSSTQHPENITNYRLEVSGTYQANLKDN